jgi:hypothetical protein
MQEQWDFSTDRCETQIANMNVIGKAEIGALVDKLATYFNVSEPTLAGQRSIPSNGCLCI